MAAGLRFVWLLFFLAGAGPVLAQLAIVQPVVAQFDGGPSVPVGSPFLSGESIFLSFDIAEYKKEGEEDFKINVSWECQAFDGAGVPMTALQKGDVKVGLAPEDKKWRPRIRVEIPLPQALISGAAEIRLTVTDHVAKASAKLAVPFQTRGPNLSGVDQLQALRFRFLRREEDTQALVVAAYRPGDTVWARFDIAGYKLGERNAFHVSYGLEVFRANGESLFAQEEAANETGDSFYPRRYMGGALSLQLTKDLAPGEYTIALRLRDLAGMQQAESKHIFRVE